MKRTVAVMAAILLVGASFAQTPLVFDDSGVDYTNTDLDTAYLSFERENDTLRIVLDDAPSAGALPGITFNVPDLGREDFFGNDIGAWVTDVEEVEILGSGNTFSGYEVTHQGVSLREVITAYTNALAAEGFEVEATSGASSNLATIVANHANGGLRIQLHRFGTGVTAYLSRS